MLFPRSFLVLSLSFLAIPCKFIAIPCKFIICGSGGARAGAGRKKFGNAMLHTAINADYLARLRELAQWEGMTDGAWLMKHLTI